MATMIDLVRFHLADIRRLCRRRGVERLEVFGSAGDAAAFDPEKSDIDFIVSFARGTDLGPWLAVYFDLQREFEQLLGRPVELVMATAMSHPLFRQEADKTRQVVYASQDTEAA